MKHLSFVLLFCVSAFALCAQTQVGYVKTKGRLTSDGEVVSGKRIGGATIQVKDRSAVVSSVNGDFSFPLVTQNFYLQSVTKNGYVVVDRDILSKQYEYSANPLVIALESASDQLDERLAAERKIRRTLQRDLQKKEDEIESLKEQNRITADEFRRRLQDIYEQQEKDEKLIAEMAKRYAKTDYDQIDEYNRQLNEYILNGELSKADSLINTKGDIHADVSELRRLEAAMAKEASDIAQARTMVDKSVGYEQFMMNKTAQECYARFEVYKAKNQMDSAAFYIGLRAALDTVNVDWQCDAADFYRTVDDYSQAIDCFSRALRIAEREYGTESVELKLAVRKLNDCYLGIIDSKDVADDIRREYRDFTHKYGRFIKE